MNNDIREIDTYLFVTHLKMNFYAMPMFPLTLWKVKDACQSYTQEFVTTVAI